MCRWKVLPMKGKEWGMKIGRVSGKYVAYQSREILT